MDTTLITEAVGNVAVSIDRSIPMSERMMTGLQTMLLGLGTVFSVLIIIMGVLTLFKLFFYVIPQKRAKARCAEETVIEDAAADNAVTDDDGALVAAITAAVAVYLSNENDSGVENEKIPAFRVVNFRRRY